MLPPRRLAAVATAVVFLGGAPAVAHAQLNVLCSAAPETCKVLVDEFQKDTGIAAMLVDTKGRIPLFTIVEQKGRPQSDVWFGGRAEQHYRAAKFSLVDAYASPTAKELQPWAKKIAEQSTSQSVGVYARVLGIGYDSALATQKKLAAPACWKDLAKPGYAGEVHISDPNGSAATYFAIAGMSQIFGEDQAFKYLKTMYKVPPPPAKKGLQSIEVNPGKSAPPTGAGKDASGAAAIAGWKGGRGRGSGSRAGQNEAAAGPVVGKALAGIGFIGDIVAEAEGGAPVKAVAPCEGTVAEVDAVSIIKGARNLDNAKKFVDWVLGAKAQALIVKTSRVYPANNATAS